MSAKSDFVKSRYLRYYLTFWATGLVSLVLVFSSIYKYTNDIAIMKENFKKQNKIQSEILAKTIEEKISYLYQSIRTMSLIPGVRKIDRYAKNFDHDAKATVQQIYNNAYTNIQLSEIYILPKSMDPEKIDPVTKKPEEPIITFDEFIVSNGADDKAKIDEESKLDEVEIEEYHLMKKQLAELAVKFPDNHSMKSLDIPVISGPEVVTCDNSEFTIEDLKNKNDTPRKGIVFTVPIYTMEGQFNGGISAIVRTNVIKKLLSNGNVGLINKVNKILMVNNPKTQWTDSIHFFKQNKANPNLIFSEVRHLTIKDLTEWDLWVAIDDSDFWMIPEVSSARVILFFGILTNLLMFLFIFWTTYKELSLAKQMNITIEKMTQQSAALRDLSHQLSESAREISDATLKQSSAVYETAGALTELSETVSKTSENAQGLKSLSAQSFEDSQNGEKALTLVLNSIKELEGFSAETSIEMDSVQMGMKNVVNFMKEIVSKTKGINEIVFQTKLLSFNASVEAARAGEHGKGFSVVAEEVGNLARMSGESANQIMSTVEIGTSKTDHLISQSSKSIEQFSKNNILIMKNATSASDQCKEAFDKIFNQVTAITKMSEEISIATNEQSLGLNEVNKAIQVISSSSHLHSTRTAEILKAIEALSRESEHMDQIVLEIAKISRLSA
jgi:methyl-accepting chemotaxis protein